MPASPSHRPFIVGIGGTTRPASSAEQAISLALKQCAELGADTRLFGGAELIMPLYDADQGTLPPQAQQLVTALRRADGVIIASPCYHGALSGLIKNALDYVEEMRADPHVYFDGRAVGAIGLGYGYQGPTVVLNQLRQITHALRGWPVPMGVSINSAVVKFTNGTCSDESIAKQIAIMAAQVYDFASHNSGKRG
jgi:FMN reductase